MSATADTVAPFAIRPVGSADDWEALLARVQCYHGVSWQRRKDINDEDCERTWRALSGNSTPNDFAQSSIAFSGVWSASIRQDAYHAIDWQALRQQGWQGRFHPTQTDGCPFR